MTFSEPFIANSARKHSVADADIRHAYRNAIRRKPYDDGFTMMIGPDVATRLLEVGVVDSDIGPIVVHAMPVRTKHLR